MDAVITYVDGNDSFWRRSFEETMNVPVREKRYRDWGTLRYLLRGIEVCMPFVENVFLVVSSLSQVPFWVSDKVRIVLHEDIIPKDYFCRLLEQFQCAALKSRGDFRILRQGTVEQALRQSIY